MEYPVIILVSAAASLATLFSGFGLGTILTPVFALFFPVETAIAMTGVVHLSNNLFKTALLGKRADWSVVLRFGLPSVLGAFLGAELLLSLTDIPAIATWQWGSTVRTIHPVNVVIALLMLAFAVMEFFPSKKESTMDRRWLAAGGVLSGFFGGLSGHQGALRAAFLVRYGLEKEAFLATGIIIACGVDLTRLSLYASRWSAAPVVEHSGLIVAAVLSAFTGAYIGRRLLTAVTLRFVQRAVAGMLVLIALALGGGFLS